MAGTVGIELVPQSLALLANACLEPQPAEDQQSRQERDEGPHMSDAATPSVNQESQEMSYSSHPADLPVHYSPDGDDHPTTAIAHEQVQESSKHDSDRPHANHQEHEEDDEHAVLIAANEDDPQNEPQQGSALGQRKSRQQGAAADRQRIWYKERAVQLTILG